MTGSRTVPWHVPKPPAGLSPVEVVFGQGPAAMGLQVAVAEHRAGGAPTREALKVLHKDRQGKFIFPLVVCAAAGDRAWLYGPSADAEVLELPLSTAERVLAAVLAEPTGLAARLRLVQLLQAAEPSENAGIANRGLFASYYLRTGAPQRRDWADAGSRALELLRLRHQELIEALGFDVLTDGHALLLRQHAASRAVAVLLDANEQFDAGTGRLGVSPVAYGLNLAAKREVAWLVLLRGSQIRLYPARPGVGVGQRGQADTWFEMDLAVVDEERSPLLQLVFSADALAPGGSTEQLLAESAQFAVELGARLRNRVYDRIIPALSQAVAAQLPRLGVPVDAAGLDLAYRLTMRILFRLLFQAYAEDRDLLPYTRSAQYRKHSLKQWALEHTGTLPGEFDAASTVIWDELLAVWKVVDSGNKGWGVPAYNGGLFGTDPARHPEGAQLTRIALDDAVLGPVLQALLVDEVESGGTGAVDFRSLSVREFGTIYEGLLESELSVAARDLTLDEDDIYVPAKAGEDVVAPAGSVYFHSASGERKATGTYFTPHVVVEHLLQRSLDPVLDEHLARVVELLDAGDQSGAADLFFDFRVADLAMGSAHFLTAAIDHIEAKMRDFLTGHPIPAVTVELATLEQAARHALGDDAAAVADIDTAALLRRQIARRCIYGLDINPMAVDLARLAIWITTFVPGLPMSTLDHNLVAGNSLTGVGTIDEALGALDPESTKSGQLSWISDPIKNALVSSRELLTDVANASEATKADVALGEAKAIQARTAAEPARLLFDAVVAARLGKLRVNAYTDLEQLLAAAVTADVQDAVRSVNPAHFPCLFPEVFLRERAGFDVVLGNPPWEEVTVEELDFWRLQSPGIKNLDSQTQTARITELRQTRPDLVEKFRQQQERLALVRRVLGTGQYPGMGVGDPDLYKPFAWRFASLNCVGGSVGVVLPTSAFKAKGSAEWRRVFLLNSQSTLLFCRNTRGWLFPEVNPGYRITLVVSNRSELQPPSLSVGGEYTTVIQLQASFCSEALAEVPLDRLEASDPNLCVPGVSSSQEINLWRRLLSVPTLGDGRAPDSRTDVRCAPATEIHATNDGKKKHLFIDSPAGIPVRNHLNISHLVFNSGPIFAIADREKTESFLLESWRSSAKGKHSAFRLQPAGWLKDAGLCPWRHPRIAFRDVVHASNPRKVWFCLVPAGEVLTNKAPYLVFPEDSLHQQAYLLGVMGSGIVDWYGHLRINLNLNYFILYSLPCPTFRERDQRVMRVAELAARLATAAPGDFEEWASFGSPISQEDERLPALAEIDALVSLLMDIPEDLLGMVFAGKNATRSALTDVLSWRKRWTTA